MTFAHIELLLLLLLLPLLAGLKLWGDLRSRNAAARVASARLLPGLLIARGRAQGWLVLFLELGALACFIIALARPQYGYLEEETGSGGRSLIIAIDTSRSMLTDDLKPNRLTRTQLAATDLVKRLRGDRIGLMPFAGSAFMYAPVTPDTDALLESIDSLDTEIIPRGGSNLARPIDLALETFAKAEATGQQVLILFSDGENLEGATLAAARRAKEKNMTIITIGVGTQAGALIPDPDAPGGYYRDPEGKPVVSRLQRDVLTSIANTTDGLYLPLDGDGVNDRRIDLILQKLQRTAMKGKVTRKALDRYRWPLGAGLLLLTGAWVAGIVERHNTRRSGPSGTGTGSTPPPLPGSATVALTTVSLGLALALAGAPSSALAAAPEKTQREIPAGNPWEFYQAGDYEAAQHNFTQRISPDGVKKTLHGDPVLEFGRGAAAFKNRDFDAAADAFGSAVLSDDLKLRAQAHFNLANSIYQSTATLAKEAKPKTLAKLTFIDGLIRKLENSLENYQQALVLQPDQQDFQSNHDTTDALIQKLREIRKQMAEQQGKGKKKSQGGGEGECEGEAEGKGKGKGKGKGQGEGNGGGGDQEEEQDGGKESEKEKEAREKSNQDKEGQIGEQGTGEDGEKGEEKGKGKDGEEDGEGGKDGEGEDGEGDGDIENEINPETGYSAAEAKRQLERLSDELTERPRIEEGRESRPARDW